MNRDRTEAMVMDRRADRMSACILGHNGPVSAPIDRCMSSIVEKCVQAVGDDSRMKPCDKSKLILQVDHLISQRGFEEGLDVQS